MGPAGPPCRLQLLADGLERERLVAGTRGSGKSTLVMQCTAACHLSDWIVLLIPRASSWVTSSAPYAYSPETQTFHQGALSAALLGALGASHGRQLEAIALRGDVRLGQVRSGDEETVVRAGASVRELCEVGAKEALLAARVLEAVCAELEVQTQ